MKYLVLILLLIVGCSSVPTVCIEGKCFEVDIAESYEEQKQGLMFIESLEEGKGMLFVYNNKSQKYFWMKNTLIPLDIIWIDNNTVVYVSDNTPICKSSESCPIYGTDTPVKYVLEVNSTYNFSIGDEVKFNGIN